MADNEAKAKKKLEEAEKKCRSGGGFLGKIFGGSGTGDAADLFIQGAGAGEQSGAHVDEQSARVQVDDESMDDEDDVDDGDPWCCDVEGCLAMLKDIVDAEEHFALVHAHQCTTCQRSFSGAHLLDVHIEEHHDPMFAAQLGRLPPATPVFRCLHVACPIRFTNPRSRDEHARIIHHVQAASGKRCRSDLADELSRQMRVTATTSACSPHGESPSRTFRTRQIARARRRCFPEVEQDQSPNQ